MLHTEHETLSVSGRRKHQTHASEQHLAVSDHKLWNMSGNAMSSEPPSLEHESTEGDGRDCAGHREAPQQDNVLVRPVVVVVVVVVAARWRKRAR